MILKWYYHHIFVCGCIVAVNMFLIQYNYHYIVQFCQMGYGRNKLTCSIEETGQPERKFLSNREFHFICKDI